MALTSGDQKRRRDVLPVADWPPLAAPDGDLPAAVGGTLAPDLILAAAHDLDHIMGDLNRFLRDRHVAERAGGAMPTLATGLWFGGAHRRVHADNPLLAALDGEFVLLAQLTGTAAAADPRPLFDTLLVIGEGLRRLFADTWNRLANIDPLTGLGNRPAMLRRLTIECERHERSRQPCCIAVIDLDNFKAINDTHGHAAGDVVLRSVAALLAAGVRPYDEVFRYGGDEFVLCLPSTDQRTAWAVVERLRLRVAGWSIPLKSGVPAQTTVSIGVAMLTAESGVEASLERADAALYAAKRGGRNHICVAAG